MNKYLLALLLAGGMGSLLFLAPRGVSAAQLSFQLDPNATSDGAAHIAVRIDPQSKVLNVVEGVIGFSGVISSSLAIGVDASGSVLTIWPTPPAYSPSEKVIRFTGGVPEGFDHESLLFRISLSSAVLGSTTVSWIGGTAYLDDGKGTTEPVSARSLTINLSGQPLSPISIASATGSAENKAGNGGPGPARSAIIVFIAIVLCLCAAAAFIAFQHGKH